MKYTVRRININLTTQEEESLEKIFEEYENRGIETKYQEAQAVRDAINWYARSFTISGKDLQESK